MKLGYYYFEYNH